MKKKGLEFFIKIKIDNFGKFLKFITTQLVPVQTTHSTNMICYKICFYNNNKRVDLPHVERRYTRNRPISYKYVKYVE